MANEINKDIGFDNKDNRDNRLESMLARLTAKLDFLGTHFFCFDAVCSTMDVAKDIICNFSEDVFDGTVITADMQACGRGRFKDRNWFSPSGGIWMSVIAYDPVEHNNSGFLNLAAAVACCNTINEYLPGCKIKWVNDVLYCNKKVSGSMIEGCHDYSIIGIGINTNVRHFLPDLADKATSVILETGRPVENIDFTVKLLSNLDQKFRDYRNSDYSRILNEYKELTDTIGKKVIVHTPDNNKNQGMIEGIVADINCAGRLVVNSGGKLSEVIEGDVVYG